ncbi:basic proline-rich protein-like [Antechinus flavipes]|uniref:basic proline-rich protein-like n=1 Tax=Antechinus flavipes TaxID=38775 RepID=UPI002235EF3D|nr:basic proline-rich protein-like [Antechinus flavipes]
MGTPGPGPQPENPREAAALSSRPSSWVLISQEPQRPAPQPPGPSRCPGSQPEPSLLLGIPGRTQVAEPQTPPGLSESGSGAPSSSPGREPGKEPSRSLPGDSVSKATALGPPKNAKVQSPCRGPHGEFWWLSRQPSAQTRDGLGPPAAPNPLKPHLPRGLRSLSLPPLGQSDTVRALQLLPTGGRREPGSPAHQREPLSGGPRTACSRAPSSAPPGRGRTLPQALDALSSRPTHRFGIQLPHSEPPLT